MVSKLPSSFKSFYKSCFIRQGLRFRSTQALIQEPLEIFRTYEDNPLHHTYAHIGHFYNITPSTNEVLFGLGGYPGKFSKQTQTFTETCLMVRQPALDIMECIKVTNFDKPVNRYVLYGKKGTGKSLQLIHLIHFASLYGFLIVHVPWVAEWLRRMTKHKEVSTSATREGFVDLPLEAAAWLLHFKTQNAKLLKELQLTTTNEYVWSKREVTPVGATLSELIDHGINRIKYSSEVITALLNEVKILSKLGKCKTFVAIDGLNTFFYPLTRLKTPLKKKITPFEVSISQGFVDITKNDWNNGVVVVTVDELGVPVEAQGSYMPRFLLGTEGFHHLDPFIPIKVDKYSPKEFASCLAYYRDRMWLRESSIVDAELEFLCARNPYRFMELCAPL